RCLAKVKMEMEWGPKRMTSDIGEHLKEFMIRVPQCVTVVTAVGMDGPIGATVSSFTSVSLRPPLVLIALDNLSETGRIIMERGLFAVNLLSEYMSELSEKFAYKPYSERFRNVSYGLSEAGLPVIEGVIAVMECRLRTTYRPGDHTLYVGEVMSVTILEEKPPLVYYLRGYTGLKV
ncbi:MAG: flavin reductase family protein, partial [Nitrososphaerota archaeon]